MKAEKKKGDSRRRFYLQALYDNPLQIDFAAAGKRRTAIFVEISDSDRSADPLIGLFYTQCMQELIHMTAQRILPWKRR